MGKGKDFQLPELERVFELQGRSWTPEAIGKYLGRDSKAIQRVYDEERHWKQGRSFRSLSPWAKAYWVRELRQKRRKGARKRGWLKSPEIQVHVLSCLRERMWSPERISGRFEEFFPGESLSAKAIYNFTKYSRVDVSEYLTERGKRRRQRVTDRRKKFQEGAPPKRSIQERPQAVEDRTELGHYEADTIHSCRGGKKAILTIRERALRRTWYFPLKNLEASTVLPVLMVFFQRLPGALCKSLTVDNGSEWSEAHHKLEKVLPGFKVYFCRPYKSYERGAVENANRDLRRFYPKGTDFGTVDEEQIKQAEKLIANWPMKCLGWRTTDEAFTEALKLAA